MIFNRGERRQADARRTDTFPVISPSSIHQLKELTPAQGHTSWVKAICFSPDGRMLASASNDQTVRLWDARHLRTSLDEIAALAGHQAAVTAVAFSPDGRMLASSGKDGLICLWDIISGKQVLALRMESGAANGVAFASDGGKLAAAGSDGLICFWGLNGAYARNRETGWAVCD